MFKFLSKRNRFFEKTVLILGEKMMEFERIEFKSRN